MGFRLLDRNEDRRAGRVAKMDDHVGGRAQAVSRGQNNSGRENHARAKAGPLRSPRQDHDDAIGEGFAAAIGPHNRPGGLKLAGGQTHGHKEKRNSGKDCHAGELSRRGYRRKPRSCRILAGRGLIAIAFIRHSGAERNTSIMNCGSSIFLAWVLAAAPLGAATFAFAAEAEGHSAMKPVCLPPGETREEVKAHHLLEPYAVLKAAQTQFKAEALSARLCRLSEEFVYEIALLHRDNRFFHVVMNATTGKYIETLHVREPVSKN